MFLPSRYQGTPYPEVTVSICRVPSPEFSQAPEHKLRCQFAEFLLLSSLKRLSIFSSPTSVGLRYGPVELELRGFSWEPIRSLRSVRTSMLHLGDSPADLPAGLLRSQTGTSNTRMIFNTPSPLRTQRRSRNINLVPISYASQPRLRGRLTLLR